MESMVLEQYCLRVQPLLVVLQQEIVLNVVIGDGVSTNMVTVEQLLWLRNYN
jgi:hypothetical protein